MFGTEIHIFTFIIIVMQLVIFVLTFFIWLRNSNEFYHFRFLTLIITFLMYNIASGLIPDEKLGINRISQNIIAYSIGVFCAIYFLYYLYNDLNVKPIKFLKNEVLIKILGANFLLLFIIPYTITQSLNLTRNLFLIIPLIIGFLAIINIYTVLWKSYIYEKNHYYKFRLFSGFIAVLSLISLPLTIIIFGDNQPVEHTLFNIGFFMVAISYFIKVRYIAKLEFKISRNNKNNQIILNSKELEIISLMFKNPNSSYEKIIEKYFSEKKLILLKNRLFSIISSLDQDNVLPKTNSFSNFNKLKSFQLTEKEIEISTLILQGIKYKNIAKKLFITEKTVSKHASNIYKKTNTIKRKNFENKFNY